MSLTIDQVRGILQSCHFPGYTWRVNGTFSPAEGPTYLQAIFRAPDADKGTLEFQHTRKWQLSSHMTKSEVVQTALKCVLTSVEHEAREQFRYRGVAIFGPHFNVDTLVDLARIYPLTEARP